MPIGLNVSKWAGGLKPFILNVQTDNAGASSSNQFTIALKTSETYNFTAVYDGQETAHSSTTDLVLTFPSGAGNYDVKIFPQDDGTGFPSIQYNDAADDTKVLQIKQWGDVLWENFSFAFKGCSNMTITATDNPLTSSCDDFSYMFHGCALITSGIDCDTSLATTMKYMYYGTALMTSVPVTDISGALDTSYMFQNSGITSVPAYVYSNITNPTGMFQNSAITSVGALDFSSATTINSLYYQCASLTSIGNLTTSTALTNVGNLIRGCSSFTGTAPTISVTSNVTTWNNMFHGSAATVCPLYDTSAATNMSEMFFDILSSTLDVPALDFTNVTTMIRFARGAASGSKGVRSLPAINAPVCTNFQQFGYTNPNLTSVGTLTWPASTGSLNTIFFFSSNLSGNITMSVGSGVTNMSQAFDSTAITGLTLTGTSGVTNFQELCDNVTELASVNLIDTSSATNCSSMFRSATGLEGFAMPTFDLGAMTNGTAMFSGFAMTTASWEALLVATEAANSNSSVTWSGGNATYNDPSSAATARAALIADHSWVISDGGPV